MSVKFERATLAGIVLVLASMAALGAFAWRSTVQLAAEAAAVQKAQRVLTLLAAVQAAMGAAESLQRAYTITGDATLLDSQRPARETVDAHLAELRALTAGDPAQYTRQVALAPLLARRFDALTAATELRRRAGPLPAQQLEAAGEGRRLQERLLGALAEMRQHGEAELARAWGRSGAAASQAQGLVLAGAALALGVAGIALWQWRAQARLLRRNLARRGNGHERQLQAEAELARLFELGPGAPCVLDREGRFVRLGAGAERVLAWGADALRGTPWIDKVQPEDRRRAERALAAAHAGQAGEELRSRWRSADGSVILLGWVLRGSADTDRVLCAVRDLTEQERLREQTSRMAQALRQGSTELAQASARGDALVQLQADMMATLDRELRAPADRLAGALDTLANEAAAPQQRQAVAARDAARQLRESTQDLLDLVALQAGRLVLQREAFDLAEVLVTGVARASALADRKGLALRVQLADDLGYARGDPARVQQVLLRLLQHAVQGTASGSVSLRAARQGSAVVSIEVADTGAGYAADDLARLFTPWQGGAERKSVLPNTGLALAQGLARAMGGEITATSRPGLGSTCTFTLPADQALGG